MNYQTDIYGDLHCKAEYLADAVRAVAHKVQIVPECVVEHYPKRHGQEQGIFSYQFFDDQGRNVGFYIPAMQSVQIMPKGREWGIPKHHMANIGAYL